MAKLINTIGFHEQTNIAGWRGIATLGTGHTDEKFTYTFRNFFHPYVAELTTAMNTSEDPMAGLLDPKTQAMHAAFFGPMYQPLPDAVTDISLPYPVKEIDVDDHGPYANYNWELFFHIPFTVAVHLSKTRRFAEAQRWFHFIFNPTSNDRTEPTPKRYWNFLAFRRDLDPKSIDELLVLLSTPPDELDAADKARQQDILDGYQAMLNKPFNPHAIARTRHVAYQYNVVMKYLDNLIAWGDDLYQQYTTETINEATLLYVLANNILGPRPEKYPAYGTTQSKTFAQLKSALDPMSNALVDLEAAFPFNFAAPSAGAGETLGAAPLLGIGRTLYFCVPRNDKLLGYWDTVADRLFKIRHCMDISGVVRPLALFDPPLDPGMLVAAAAAGIDIGSIVAGLNASSGPMRATFLVQKAVELAGEVKALGGGLLAAIEKGDAEHLAQMRQRHEIAIHQISQDTRYLQLQNAQEQVRSLTIARETAGERFAYYARLLGLPIDQNATIPAQTDFVSLTEENFAEAYAKLVTAYDKTITRKDLPPNPLANASAIGTQAGTSGPGQLYLNTNENTDLNVLPPAAREDRQDAMHSDTVTGLLSLIPDMGLDLHFWGLGGHMNVFGGTLLASAGRFYSSLKNTSAADKEGQSQNAAKTGGHQRRADDWLLQYNLAAHELRQNGRQILGALIGQQVAQREYDTIVAQLANAREIGQVLSEKFSNEDLYLWMQGELSRLYYEYYRFAFDAAQRAERAMKLDLMRPEVDGQSFVKFNYWDAGRKGLLSGEALHLDLKRMELAYHDNNKRELELTRHVSLRQLDPLALLSLKTGGTCAFAIPEWLYDRDCPGHYMRRIKSVALSIPSVTGPYTSVNCTLQLLASSVRKSATLKDDIYSRQGMGDDRFVDYGGGGQTIVTSTAVNDSGLFETNLRDERYLPFEGVGAVSRWQLSLPDSYRPFDYATISDVIVHVRYTARAGVRTDKVKTALDDIFQEASADGAELAMLFSLPHDFPTEWAAFVGGSGDLSLSVSRDYFPYFAAGKTVTLTGLEVRGDDGKHHVLGNAAMLTAATTALTTAGAFTVTSPPDPTGPTQALTRTPGKDVFLIVRYILA